MLPSGIGFFKGYPLKPLSIANLWKVGLAKIKLCIQLSR
jgi:hypothetical protein